MWLLEGKSKCEDFLSAVLQVQLGQTGDHLWGRQGLNFHIELRINCLDGLVPQEEKTEIT